MKTLTTLAVFSFAAALTAAEERVLFSTQNQLGTEQTVSGSGATHLQFLGDEAVGIVVPAVGLGHSAETFFPAAGWNAQAGDENGDGLYNSSPLLGAVDALMTRFGSAASIRDVYFSTSQLVGAAGCLATIRPGDIVRYQSGAAAEYFLTEGLIRQAFSIPANWPVNVDALEVDPGGSIFLSFEDNLVALGVAVADGAVLMIPAAAINYSASGLVLAVGAGSGEVALTEAEVDGMVVNARVQNPTTGVVNVIGDLDGLALDPLGGTFTVLREDGPHTYANLLFCGQELLGGAILSTANLGSIPTLNGLYMAYPVAGGMNLTNGDHVGLSRLAHDVGSLNALDVVGDSARLVMDAPTVSFPAAGPFHIDLGGADAFAPILMGFRVGPSVFCGVAPSVAVATPGFDAFYGPMTYLPIVLADADGFRRISGAYPGGAPVGTAVVLQSWTFVGGQISLSSPLQLQF